jgi:hypothetical protein
VCELQSGGTRLTKCGLLWETQARISALTRQARLRCEAVDLSGRS